MGHIRRDFLASQYFESKELFSFGNFRMLGGRGWFGFEASFLVTISSTTVESERAWTSDLFRRAMTSDCSRATSPPREVTEVSVAVILSPSLVEKASSLESIRAAVFASDLAMSPLTPVIICLSFSSRTLSSLLDFFPGGPA